MDLSILQMLKHREQYDKLIPDLPENALHEKTMTMVRAFGKWFSETEETTIDMEAFKVYFFNFVKPHASEKSKLYYNTMLEQCKKDPHERVQNCMFERMVEMALAHQVANKIAQYGEGEELHLIDEIGLLQQSAVAKLASTSEEFVDITIEEILTDDEDDTGLQFTLPDLRETLRPLRAGDFIITGGRPDVGKTSFIASQLCGFLDGLPLGRPVVWFNNEGAGNRIIKRIYQSILAATTDDLISLKRQGTLGERYQLRTGGSGRIKVIDCHSWNTYRVERAIKHFKPGLVIFDMLDNINWTAGAQDQRSDQKLESLYQWARVLGVTYDFPVLATSQISAEAEREPETLMWTPDHMLKDSKTGKQGAADTIIMIGRNQDPTNRNARYISTPKNKLARTGVSYLQAECRFDPQRAQYI